MAKDKKIIVADLSTEEKIKAAAKKLFTQKGLAATRTRDIAKEAGINLALLNYYFRSKEKLFDLVINENVHLFLGEVIENINNTPRPFEKQVEFIVNSYIDMLLKNPDLPFFILNLLQSTESTGKESDDRLSRDVQRMRNSLLKNMQESIQKGEIKISNPRHFTANMMSLIIFPFVASKLLMSRTGNNYTAEFEQMMIERKKMIPKWLKAMIQVN